MYLNNFEDSNISNDSNPQTHKTNRYSQQTKLYRKITIIWIVAIISLLSIFAALYYSYEDRQKTILVEDMKKKQNEVFFVPLEDIVVNLDTQNQNPSFLKLTVLFEITGQDGVNAIKKNMPKIKDLMITYLRSLAPEDIKGSIGVYKLREELMLRVNKVINPNQVNDVVFNDILVQY